MWVEVLEPMTVTTKDGAKDVDPGTPFELSEEQAQRLLALANGKVKVCVPERRSTLLCCHACRGNRFWTASEGTEPRCATCHPPVDRDRVEWVMAKTDLHDSRFRDAFHALSKWIDSVRPPLWDPRYAHVFKEYSHADAAWMRGDLVGFREGIENYKRAIKRVQESIAEASSE